jgi:hypothetical protein
MAMFSMGCRGAIPLAALSRSDWLPQPAPFARHVHGGEGAYSGMLVVSCWVCQRLRAIALLMMSENPPWPSASMASSSWPTPTSLRRAGNASTAKV